MESQKNSIATTNDWGVVSKKIYNGFLMYLLAGILLPIVDGIEGISGGLDFASSMASGEGFGGGISFWGIVVIAAKVAIVLGYVWYLTGLSKFALLQEGEDGVFVNKLKLGGILYLVGIGVGFIPIIGWIAEPVLIIIGLVLTMTGFNGLKNSQTFPQKGRDGAAMLSTAVILMIVGACVNIIPLVGGFACAVLYVVAFLKGMKGWKAIVEAK